MMLASAVSISSPVDFAPSAEIYHLCLLRNAADLVQMTAARILANGGRARRAAPSVRRFATP